MASKKSVPPAGTKPKPRPPQPPRPGKRASAIEVDAAWLEQLSEDEKPRSKAPRPPPPPPSKRGAPPPPSKKDSGEIIDVNTSWLIPSMPPAQASPAPRPPPPPATIAVKPRGKLPPPLPRDDDD